MLLESLEHKDAVIRFTNARRLFYVVQGWFILTFLGMKNVKIGAISMSTTLKLDNDIDRKPIDVKDYKGMIGLLSYLTASKPDIIFSVCSCACFQASPK